MSGIRALTAAAVVGALLPGCASSPCVTVNPDGAIEVDGQRVAADHLASVLSSRTAGRTGAEAKVLFTDPDRTHYEHLHKVLGAVWASGLRKVEIGGASLRMGEGPRQEDELRATFPSISTDDANRLAVLAEAVEAGYGDADWQLRCTRSAPVSLVVKAVQLLSSARPGSTDFVLEFGEWVSIDVQYRKPGEPGYSPPHTLACPCTWGVHYVIYVVDPALGRASLTLMTNGVAGSITRLRERDRFTVLVAGRGMSSGFRGGQPCEPLPYRQEAARFLQGLEPQARTELPQAIRNAWELAQRQHASYAKKLRVWDRYTLYVCTSTDPRGVVALRESLRPPSGIRDSAVIVFLYGGDPNQAPPPEWDQLVQKKLVDGVRAISEASSQPVQEK